MKLRAAVPFFLLAVAAQAQAASAPPDPKAMAGAWTLSGTHEGDPDCKVKLTTDQAIGGWAIEVPRTCVKAFPKMADVAAWTIYGDKGVGLIDALRKAVYRFTWAQDAYVTDPAKPGLQLMLAREAHGPAPTVRDRMSGAWSLTGMGGEPRCGFTSTAKASGAAGTLVMKPGCAAKWKAQGWVSWTLSGGRLILFDQAGKPLQRFTQGDVVTFEGEDAAGDLIYFSRD